MTDLNPDQITLTDDSVSDAYKICVIQGVYNSENEYNGNLGARISSIFVIFFVSTFFTFFPVISAKVKTVKVPLWVYWIARNFGTGVIVTTAFIHLMDPAYKEIGGTSCVGMTGNWSAYSWCPAIMLVTVFFIFFVDLASEVYVERKYNISHVHNNDEIEDILQGKGAGQRQRLSHSHDGETGNYQHDHDIVHEHTDQHSHADQDYNDHKLETERTDKKSDMLSFSDVETLNSRKSFDAEIGAFLILEFGVIFHSVMIGLNLGSTGDEFASLYPVLVFHQTFEGLGIGARLSAIEFPRDKRMLPYFLCLAYGLTTPIAIAIGLGVRTSYVSGSYTANVISGVLDAISAGTLIYTGLVELLARDFIFNEKRTKDLCQLFFQLFSMLWGAGLMALLGKWA